jgi:uncharacterized membrane protein YbhN (UPF0104 family)
MRVLAAVAIVAILLAHSGLEQVSESFQRVSWWPLGVSVLGMALDIVLRTMTWRRLLSAIEGRVIGFRALLGCFLTSSLFGTFLPSTAATDATRALLAHQAIGGSLATIAASLVVLNAMTLFAGCLVALAAAATASVTIGLPATILPGILLLLALAIVLPALYLGLRFRRDLVIVVLRRLKGRWLRLRRGLRRFLDSVLVFEQGHARVEAVLPLAVAILVTDSVILAVTGMAFQVYVPIVVWLMLPPLIGIVRLLPLSVLGLGAIQAAIVVALAGYGVREAQALSMAMMNAFLWVCVNAAAGGIAFAVGAGRPVSSDTRG